MSKELVYTKGDFILFLLAVKVGKTYKFEDFFWEVEHVKYEEGLDLDKHPFDFFKSFHEDTRGDILIEYCKDRIISTEIIKRSDYNYHWLPGIIDKKFPQYSNSEIIYRDEWMYNTGKELFIFSDKLTPKNIQERNLAIEELIKTKKYTEHDLSHDEMKDAAEKYYTGNNRELLKSISTRVKSKKFGL